jgi:hypothetical protein
MRASSARFGCGAIVVGDVSAAAPASAFAEDAIWWPAWRGVGVAKELVTEIVRGELEALGEGEGVADGFGVVREELGRGGCERGSARRCGGGGACFSERGVVAEAGGRR